MGLGEAMGLGEEVGVMVMDTGKRNVVILHLNPAEWNAMENPVMTLATEGVD